MKQPLVSVIIPVYGVEAYLDKCVTSVVSQTYKNLEIFLIDDGSPDNCPKMCDEWAKKDPRIVVIHKENGGQGSARNVALDLAQGAYISFVDADDTIKSDMLELLLHAAQANDAEMAICGLAVNSGVRFVEQDVYPSYRVFSTKELLKEYVTTGNIFSGPCNKLYKSCLFDGLRFPNFRANEDAYIMHELLGRCKKAVHVGKCLYIQYIRSGSTERSPVTEKNLALLACADSLKNYFEQEYPELFQYVAYKKADDCAELMQRMLRLPRRQRNEALYSRLNTELIEEFEKTNQQFPNSPHVKSRTVLAVKKPRVFRLASVIAGVKSRMKALLKNIFLFFKNKK